MQYRLRKYLIVGPWVNHRKIVKDLLVENTDLKVSPRKLRVVQLAHSDKDVAIGDPYMVFNNPNVSEEVALRDLDYLKKYNVGLIYVGSSISRESHLIIEGQVRGNERYIDLKLVQDLFENGLLKNKLREFFKDRWDGDV